MTTRRKEPTDADTTKPPLPSGCNRQKRLRECLPSLGVYDFDLCSHYLFGSTSVLYEFFHANGYRLPRSVIVNNSVSPQLRAHLGWVYAFYGANHEPIYIGETGRTFVKRFKEHQNKNWWSQWCDVKVLPCPDRGIRKYFESMLGIAGGYVENRAQPTGANDLFDQVLRSLLVLGNNLGNEPKAPIDNIKTHMKMIREMLASLRGNIEI